AAALARFDAARAATLFAVDQPDLAGLMIVGADDDETPRQGFADREEEAGIAILVYFFVLLLLRSEDVTVDELRAVLVVQFYIVERLGVPLPHHAAAGIYDAVGQFFSRAEIAHDDGIEFRALVVIRPGQQFMIVAVVDAAELEKFLALRLKI